MNKKWLSFAHPKLNAAMISWLGIIMALQLILSKISFGPQFLKISPAFVMTALLGYYFGPWWAGLAGIFTDILGHTILGGGGEFFLGFTFSAFVAPFLYGMVLHNHRATLQRTLLATTLVTLINNIFLNTLWVVMLYHLNVKVILPIRIGKNIISWIIETIILFVVLRFIEQRHLQFKHK
ncbi:MAG: folate family ECF transporter S component [Candidatus Paralactobacillus gallistercoris]|uniref:Folate family ECF transporter S component n=1 Tax=Candidatus Paralactobacillus gallistercoris TaxID=2838724 RepID=A0A948X3C0_9LACO|nr:folate family ECF transporter S component [Candidatus Paralactobacillus gallistercoris]